MSFFHRYRSAPMQSVVRVTEGGVLVGREVVVQIDFTSETLDDRGLIVPEEAIGRLEDGVRDLFDGKLLIDNSDPYADDLVKLKRIRAADPVLFEHGTSGPQLAFYVGRWAEEWLLNERWAPKAPEDVRYTQIALATVQLGRNEFFYDLA